MANFMESQALQHLTFPTVAFNGAAAAPPTFDGASPPSTPAGTVTTQSAALDDGTFDGQVTASRRAVVLLKTTDEPGWQVTVDGAKAQPIMVAPSFVGVVVPPGSHSIVFQFATYPYYAPLLALGVLAFLALVLLPRRLGARRVGSAAHVVAAEGHHGTIATRCATGVRTFRCRAPSTAIGSFCPVVFGDRGSRSRAHRGRCVESHHLAARFGAGHRLRERRAVSPEPGPALRGGRGLPSGARPRSPQRARVLQPGDRRVPRKETRASPPVTMRPPSGSTTPWRRRCTTLRSSSRPTTQRTP